MKILNAEQIKALDAYTIAHEPIASIDLMERAAHAFVDWLDGMDLKKRPVFVFCGPGNNGGDGLAIAAMLIGKSYKVHACCLPGSSPSREFVTNEKRLLDLAPIQYLRTEGDFPSLSQEMIIIDALFGVGLNRPLEGIPAALVAAMNASGATIVSVDIASGLFCDSENKSEAIVQATNTVTFQLPKLSFLLPQNDRFVGDWVALDIGLSRNFIDRTEASWLYTDEEMVRPMVRGRAKYTHKGSFGKALIIGGNYGMMGAAALSVQACCRSGAGLVQAYVPSCGYDIMQTLAPEAMVVTDPSAHSITTLPSLEGFAAIGIGPGISEAEPARDVLLKLLKKHRGPLVVDAGALNLLGRNKEMMKFLPPNSILTPHPKEFERLTRVVGSDYERLELLRAFAKEVQCFVVLKGAHTAIACPDGRVYFNSTGNPGMATGGSGDVLTGIITGLLSQSYTALEASVLGVFMHGSAGDIAAKRKSQQALLASDIIHAIGDFYLEIK